MNFNHEGHEDLHEVHNDFCFGLMINPELELELEFGILELEFLRISVLCAFLVSFVVK